MTRPYVYRTTFSSVQDRYGYNSFSENEPGKQGTVVRVNNPVKTDLRVNTVNDILGDVDQIKPKMGARIRDDAHHHQGMVNIRSFSILKSKVVLIIIGSQTQLIACLNI